MRNIIRDRAIVADDYVRWNGEGAMPVSDRLLVPLAVYAADAESITTVSKAGPGIIVTGDTEPDDILPWLPALKLIAIEFPKFTDGRGYSLARLLRERHGFRGELRAVGDVLRDQIFLMHRCGFNAFEVRADRSLEDALHGLRDFTVTYQGDVHDPRPLYRRQ
jgi:uncharacterized protein (DUF934 family)